LITSFNQLYGYHAIRSTYHTTLQATPCQLVFGRDMIHNIDFTANLNKIQKRKQDITSNYNQKKNKSWIPYEHKVGDQVLLETPGTLSKLSTPCTGPYPVTNVYKNGAIRIQKRIVSGKVNIRRITPFDQNPNKVWSCGWMTYHRVWNKTIILN
jgi:hypothetical protein